MEWSLSGKENVKEEMEIWPKNDYNKRGRSADITLRYTFIRVFLPKGPLIRLAPEV